MAVYDLEEQEKLDSIKNWWERHGNKAIWAAIAVLAVAAAWLAWNWRQDTRARAASELLEQYTDAGQTGDKARAAKLAGELAAQYPGTAQADLAALYSAKAFIEQNDLKTAAAHLAWAMQDASGELADVARLRLAGVLLDEKSYDEALKTLAHKPAPAFDALYANLRGDIYAAQNKAKEARAAYEAALKALGDDPAAKAGDAEAKAGDAKKPSDPNLALLIRQKLAATPKGDA